MNRPESGCRNRSVRASLLHQRNHSSTFSGRGPCKRYRNASSFDTAPLIGGLRMTRVGTDATPGTHPTRRQRRPASAQSPATPPLPLTPPRRGTASRSPHQAMRLSMRPSTPSHAYTTPQRCELCPRWSREQRRGGRRRFLRVPSGSVPTQTGRSRPTTSRPHDARLLVSLGVEVTLLGVVPLLTETIHAVVWEHPRARRERRAVLACVVSAPAARDTVFPAGAVHAHGVSPSGPRNHACSPARSVTMLSAQWYINSGSTGSSSSTTVCLPAPVAQPNSR